MSAMTVGRYSARLAASAQDIARARRLRALAFQGNESVPEGDALDARCQHLLIESRQDSGWPRLVACCRFQVLTGSQIARDSYSAQFYGLDRLAQRRDPAIEIGRFCLRPGLRDPDVLRLAWAALTVEVDRVEATFLFGCASLPGTDGDLYRPLFSYLLHEFQAPQDWRPSPRAPERIAFEVVKDAPLGSRDALRAMPPLLRSYLQMGGQVGDHAVVDRQMRTLHVFTGVDVARIPAARQRLLRLLAGQVMRAGD